MSWVIEKKALAVAVLIFLLTSFSPATAATPASRISSSCWATGSLAESPAAAIRSVKGWHCGDSDYSIKAERALLRFDISPGGERPRYLLSRRSALETVHVLLIEADGVVRQTSVPASALQNSRYGGYFKVPLPTVSPRTRQIVVAFDRPSHRMTLERAYLTPKGVS